MPNRRAKEVGLSSGRAPLTAWPHGQGGVDGRWAARRPHALKSNPGIAGIGRMDPFARTESVLWTADPHGLGHHKQHLHRHHVVAEERSRQAKPS